MKRSENQMYNQWLCWQSNAVRAMGPKTCKTCISGYNKGGYMYCNRNMIHLKVKSTYKLGCWK